MYCTQYVCILGDFYTIKQTFKQNTRKKKDWYNNNKRKIIKNMYNTKNAEWTAEYLKNK